MKRFTKCLIWLLVLSLCVGMLGLPVFAADTGMDYFFNDTAADPEGNGLWTRSFSDRELDPTQGTHRLLGYNLESAYAPAYLWGKKHSSETEPALVDAAGREYYRGDAESRFLSYELYLDDYWVDGVHYYTPEGEYTFARYGDVDHFVLADAETGSYSTAYCVDNGQNAVVGSYYDIENLEDAGYYNAYQAEKIRAIALTGYWGQTSGTGSLAAMKAALAASGEFTAEELALVNDGVAMSATQFAIWHFANANDSVEDATTNAQYEKMRKVIGTYWCNGDFYERLSEEQKPAAEMVFRIGYYLINMDPASVENTTANTVITKDGFLTSLGVTNAELIEGHENNLDTNEDNNAYTADVSFTMAVIPAANNGDDLVAKIVDENGEVLATGRIAGDLQEGEVQLAGSNGTYTFEDLELVEGVQKLKIQMAGHQELKQGVYLYNPVDGRGASQTMIGIGEGTHAVDVALDWDLKFSVNEPPERIITITKTTPGENRLPLQGIQFDFYCVAGRDEYLAGKVELPDASVYTDLPDVPDYTIVTDANGQGVFNLTENNLPDGVYLVVERAHPAIVAPVDPFYVIVPGTTEDGSGLVYQIDIYPKNDVRGNVEIEKDVISIGNNNSTQDVGAIHTWIIGTTIPADIGQGKSFVISDTLDNRLDFLNNVRVRVENKNGTVVAATLTEGVDYTVTVTNNDSVATGESDSFTVSLTESGMQNVASAATAGITHIRVYFDAQINANAGMGEEIPNQAKLDYTNSVGVSFHPVSDKPEVHTGGARLLKVDANNHATVLPGAEFKLYRKATETEVGDKTIEKVTIGDMVEPMVPVYFYNNANLSGEKTDTAVSDENGNIYIYGLAYGEYYLVETKAPAGYNLMGDSITLTINAESHTDAAVVVVENTSGTVLPETGGIGTEMFTVSGMILLLAAVVMLLKKRGIALI